MAEKRTGCLEGLIGLAVLCALPGVLLDTCGRSEPSGALLVAPVADSVDPGKAMREWDAEVRRRFRASAPWAR